MRFTCNICNQPQECSEELLTRETPSCAVCGSTVRFRSLAQMVSRELFDRDLALANFPRLKSIKGLGLSDWEGYARVLAEKFDYINTFLGGEPQFDIARPDPFHYGRYDFLIAADVFEHVEPPVEQALRAAHDVLKPDGVFLMTVPYTLEPAMHEHFPELHQYRLVDLEGAPVLVNRTRDGRVQIFENLVFHKGRDSVLEMRLFNESSLKQLLLSAGFREVEVCSRERPEFGVVHREPWSLPVVARKAPRSSARVWVTELMDQIAQRDATALELQNRIGQLERELAESSRRADQVAGRLDTLREQVRMAGSSRWLSLGRRFGVGPRFTSD
jgi:SAM-dependent methyltransferase